MVEHVSSGDGGAVGATVRVGEGDQLGGEEVEGEVVEGEVVEEKEVEKEEEDGVKKEEEGEGGNFLTNSVDAVKETSAVSGGRVNLRCWPRLPFFKCLFCFLFFFFIFGIGS